jgi:Tol biopolymer transport system component
MAHRWECRTRGLGVVLAIVGVAALSARQRHLKTIRQSQPYTSPLASASVSGDGRFVAFESLTRLVPADHNDAVDIYVLEIASGRVELVSVGMDGKSAGDSSLTPRLSGDGRYVVFDSITPRPQPPCGTVFFRDRYAGLTRALVTARDNPSWVVCAKRPAISADGEWVAFESNAEDLVEGVDANGAESDVYLANIRTRHVARVSLSSDGSQPASGASYAPSVSGRGELVAFTSTACLDGGPREPDPPSGPVTTPCKPRVFVRNVSAGRTRGVTAAGGMRPNGSTHSPALTADGTGLAFVSAATNLQPGDRNDRPDVYFYELRSGRLELLSRTPRGMAGNGASLRPAISETGRYVAFDSGASDLVCSGRCASGDYDHNLVNDVFLLDRQTGLTSRLSQYAPRRPWWEPSIGPAVDATGRVVVFSSRHATDEDDVDGLFDLFMVTTMKGPMGSERGRTPPALAATASTHK